MTYIIDNQMHKRKINELLNISSTAKSILIKESYWRNGEKHGIWKEYFKDNTFKTIKYESNLLIDVSRFDEVGNLCDGKYEGVKFNYAHQKDMVMCIEYYDNGVLQHGVYYKDEGHGSNPENDELVVDSIYTKSEVVENQKLYNYLKEKKLLSNGEKE